MTKNEYNSATLIIADSCRGVYIPQFAAERWAELDKNREANKAHWRYLTLGPDVEYYWDAWAAIEDSAVIVMGDHEWTFRLDGDLFLVRSDAIGCEECEEGFYLPGERCESCGHDSYSDPRATLYSIVLGSCMAIVLAEYTAWYLPAGIVAGVWSEEFFDAMIAAIEASS